MLSQTAAGRVGDEASMGLAHTLKRVGFVTGRLKTGTPPRLDARTIDFSKITVQRGDINPHPFSFMNDVAPLQSRRQMQVVFVLLSPYPLAPSFSRRPVGLRTLWQRRSAWSESTAMLPQTSRAVAAVVWVQDIVLHWKLRFA